MENDGRPLVLCFLFIFSLGFVNSQIPVATGSDFTFRPSVKGQIESLDWRHNGNLVVEWDPSSNPDPHWYRYDERASLDIKTGELTLKMMKKEDSGPFKGQFSVKAVLQYWERDITVIDPLPKPKVNCEVNYTNITLTCSLETPVQASFSWTGPNDFTHVGNNVHITRNAEDSVYYCTAVNEVSKTYTEFNLKNCPKGPHNNGGHNIGAIVGGIFGVLSVIVGVVVVYFLKKKQASGESGKNEEYEVVGNREESNETSNNHKSETINFSQEEESPGK